jgi:hypothetical protein
MYCDWSQRGISAILAQTDPEDGLEYMVACVSRSLNRHEARYEPTKGEALAVVWGVKTLHPLLHGVPFTVVTDHRPLAFMFQSQNVCGQYARWAMVLQQYDITIRHRPGTQHGNADALSRFPRDDSTDNSEAREQSDDHPLPVMPPVVFAAQDHEEEESAEKLDLDNQTTRYECVRRRSSGGWKDDADNEDDGNEEAPVVLAAVKSMLMDRNPDNEEPLNMTPLPRWTLEDMRSTKGVNLIELFGGLCAGLEACLKNGIKVRTYRYCDINPACRTVARERVKKLQQRYPHLLHDTAAVEMFALPQDVTKIKARHVQDIVDDAEKPPWLIVAGWSCEDLSPAGNGAGLAGKRSGLFYPLLRVIRMFQYWAPENTVGYLLENVAMQFNWKHRGPREDFMVIQHLVGKATTVDAARLGSYTHRLRNFFTNLVDPVILQDQLDAIERPVNLGAISVFPPHVELQPLRSLRKAPYYTCGVVGQPPQAMPTLMARKRSYSFRDNGPGVVYDRVLGPREPNITERELLLGYPKGTVDIPGISDDDKHRITGGCMDAITMTTLIRLAIPEHCDAHPLNNALLSLGEGDGIATVEPEHDICEATDNMDNFRGASGNARATTDGNDAPDGRMGGPSNHSVHQDRKARRWSQLLRQEEGSATRTVLQVRRRYPHAHQS